MSKKTAMRNKLDPLQSPSLKSWGEPAKLPHEGVVVECGWGRLIFAHTFRDNEKIAALLKEEKEGYRDIALYLRDPQVVISYAPQDLFIDPSYTFRLWLDEYKPNGEEPALFTVRPIDTDSDIESLNRIYRTRGMVPVDPEFLKKTYKGKFIHYWVAEDNESGEIVAACMSIDHHIAFDDPENGSSLWALAVDPQAPHSGVGIGMVRHIAAYYKKEGRKFIDLSVLHSNEEAIALYKKLGFTQIPVFCVKNKNAINEKLFAGPQPEEKLNPYATIIINEARRRGIRVDVLDPVDNYFQLSYGGASIVCRESLTELTSSIAMSRCSDKQTTHRLLRNAGLRAPQQQPAGTPLENQAFLKKHGRIVVKPAVGEQGSGITMDIRTRNELARGIEEAQKVSRKVLLEEMIEGQDLRIIVIDYEVVAAAVRRPPMVVGDGTHSILQLVEKQSRRRERATQGESRIPIDGELRRTVNNAGYRLEDILPEGREIQVRRAANLHAGGTIHDVTDQLHPALIEAAKQAAHVLDIPVTGLDFIVKSPSQPDYVIIEANERPGLANHEPQPTAQRFVDFLFPQSIARDI